MKRITYLFLLIMIISIAGCSDSADMSTRSADKEVLDKMEVDFKLLSNNQFLNESMIEITITNTSEKAYSGTVSFSNTSFQYWDIDIENLPPGKHLTKQVKNEYIKYPEDGINYEFKGDLSDKNFVSEVDYELFKTEVENSFDVQTDYVDEDVAKEIISELYSKHGPLIYVGIYDKNQKVEDDDILPRAQYFGRVDQTITFYFEDKPSEKINFNPYTNK